MQDDEFFWERLLQAVETGLVVPFVGRELLTVATDSGPQPFHHVVAARLAATLSIAPSGLPPDFDTNDVICAYQGFHGNPMALVPRVVSIVKSLKPDVPEPLRLLAEIPQFRLFVSTTFDTLLEEAITQVRGHPPALLAFPAASSQTDFDEALLERHGAMVFQILGRCAGGATFAVTEGQTLELMHELMSGTRRPNKLLAKLQDSHLLMLGMGFPDWLSRLLLRLARTKPLWDSRDRDEIIAVNVPDDVDLPRFLHRFSPEHSHTFDSGGSLDDFVRELHRRWFERFPAQSVPEAVAPLASEEPEKMTRGSIFISYATEDRRAAFQLADRLVEANLEVWVDRRLNPGDDFRYLIERHIRECSTFVAVLSRTTQTSSERWFRREWAQACDRSAMTFGTDRSFLFPVVVDDVDMGQLDDTLNRLFKRTAVLAPGGVPPSELVRQLDLSQKAWRKQFAARA